MMYIYVTDYGIANISSALNLSVLIAQYMHLKNCKYYVCVFLTIGTYSYKKSTSTYVSLVFGIFLVLHAEEPLLMCMAIREASDGLLWQEPARNR